MQKAAASKSGARGKQRSPIFPSVICLGAGWLVTLVFSMFFSMIFAIVDLPELVVDVLAIVSLALGALVTGVLCSRAFPKERGLMALICGLASAIVLVVLNLAFFREPITALSFLKYAAIVVSAFLGAAFYSPSKGKQRKKKLKKR